jgi:hypothetical protein
MVLKAEKKFPVIYKNPKFTSESTKAGNYPCTEPDKSRPRLKNLLLENQS